MAHREGSIYLYLFVVACVLFLIMTVMFFVNNAAMQEMVANNSSLNDKLKRAQDSNKTLVDDINALKELIGGPRTPQDWPNLADLRNHFFKDELVEKAQRAINETLAGRGEAPRSYTHLVEPYSDLPVLLQKVKEAREAAEQASQRAQEIEMKAKKDADATVADLRKSSDETKKDLGECQTKLEDVQNAAKTREAELLAEMDKVREGLLEKIVYLNRDRNMMENKVRSLETIIADLRKEMRKEENLVDIKPDGRIEQVLSSMGKAWINLGRVNHLTNGLKFRVYQTVKGGKKVFKGSIEIQKVDETTSEARITEEVDPLNAIIPGDLITSPFYDPKATPVFVFAGSGLESKDVTKEFVEAKMKSYGAEIRKNVDSNTTFLVALKEFEATPEYKTAKELGVTIIREKDLLEFIGH